ncbi:MAG: FecR domain-containing protein, partial [Prolixibacteraceae bacterium]
MTDKNYSEFNAADFAADELFLQWRMAADEESDRFWTNFIETHPWKKDDVLSAIRIVNSVRINDCRFIPEELLTGWARINHSVKTSGIRKKRLVYTWSVASSLAILLIASYFSFFTKPVREKLTPVNRPGNKEIRLTLPDQSSVTFGENTDIIYDQKGNITVTTAKKKELLTTGTVKGALQMNKLIVPPGKISSLTLSDGSKIWINSGTVLEFPTVFEDHQRKIKIDGEIYIEVARNEKNPFIVSTSSFLVNVLGTKFNVSAYNEDPVQRIVLVRGSVEVKMKSGNPVKLEPDEMLSLSETGFHSEKVDVYDYISWKDGIFRFTGEPLERILTRLSRHYDVPITCDDDAKRIQVTGKLALFDDLTTVLDNITVILPVTYEIENNKIIISKK